MFSELELNVEGDVFRARTLLEMVKTISTGVGRIERRGGGGSKGETLRPKEHGHRRVSRLTAC